MSLTVIGGLPAHVLFVHFVVVLVPVTSLAVVVCAVWPHWARRLGVALPLLALVTLASVPLATHAGGWLEAHVGSDPLVRKHTALGDTMLPWAGGLFLVAVAVWWAGRRSASAPAAAQEQAQESSAATAGGAAAGAARMSMTTIRVAASVLALAVSVGAVVDVYRIGESGSKAAWHDSFSKTATGQGG